MSDLNIVVDVTPPPVPQPPPVYRLICEGSCNTSLASVTAAVVKFRKREVAGVGGPMSIPPDDIVRELRALRHTDHVAVEGREWFFRCTVCRTPRRCGGSAPATK